jgi:hypothetical protein
MLKYLTLVALATGFSAAHADEVKPFAAQLITLGDVQGVAYFTEETDGFRLVTTLAQGEGGRPVRVIATLNDGQSIRLSIPHGVDEAEEAIEIVRYGKVLMLRDPVEPLTASIE